MLSGQPYVTPWFPPTPGSDPCQLLLVTAQLHPQETTAGSTISPLPLPGRQHCLNAAGPSPQSRQGRDHLPFTSALPPSQRLHRSVAQNTEDSESALIPTKSKPLRDPAARSPLSPPRDPGSTHPPSRIPTGQWRGGGGLCLAPPTRRPPAPRASAPNPAAAPPALPVTPGARATEPSMLLCCRPRPWAFVRQTASATFLQNGPWPPSPALATPPSRAVPTGCPGLRRAGT